MNKYKLIYGVGIDDADYPVRRKADIVCPFFKRWIGILQRGFSENWKIKHPSYKDVIVADEWLRFSNFKAWMEQQYWDGLHLDKDILIKNNKVYSKNTCVFVPRYINVFLRKVNKENGLPIGVKQYGVNKDRYQANTAYNYLGTFSTPEEAHRAWQKDKIGLFEPLLEKYRKEIYYKPEVDLALILRKQEIEYEYSNFLQTTYP